MAELVQAIENYLAAWDQDPKPFVWTATVESIMEKLDRAMKKLEDIKPGCTVRATWNDKMIV